MKEKNSKKYLNAKIQNLFMCKRQIEKLRQKVLGLIQQPCEDFQWCKKKVINRKNQYQQKIKSKSKSNNQKDKSIEQKFINAHDSIKKVSQKKKKVCPCTHFWSLQTQKIKKESPLRKNIKQKINLEKDAQTIKKIRQKIRSTQNKFFEKGTPKKKKYQKRVNLQASILKPSIFVNESVQIEAPLTVRKSNKINRCLNTESTVDNTSDKKLQSSESVLLYSRTQRVKFQQNDELNQSLLLSQKSNKDGSQPSILQKSSMRRSRKSKGSLIRIQKNQQKDHSANKNSLINQEDSLLISALNSKYWKESLKKITDSIGPLNQQRIIFKNLLQSEKQNDQYILNRPLMHKKLEKNDFTTSQTLRNSNGGQQYKKPLTLDMIKKICQITQKFMNRQIYPFRDILCDEDETQNFKKSLELSKSIDFHQQKKELQMKKCKLWIEQQ